jgi:hypothetical protein
LKTDEGKDSAYIYTDKKAQQETKPPLGLRPQYIVELQRIQEIFDAIIRYKKASLIVPSKWIEELARLVSE